MWRVLLVVSLASASYAQPAKPPHGATKIKLDYERSSWQRTEEHHVIAWTGGRYVAKSTTIDPKLIDDLYASLTDLRDATHTLRCKSHTDDYPKFKVVVEGSEPLEIEADSNCEHYRPWMVTRNGKLHVQFTGKVWNAVGALMAAVNKEWEKRRVRHRSGGIELVWLGEYPKSTTGELAACAKSFEAEPQLRAQFGNPRVHELNLFCELDASPDCSTVTARAEFKWQGLAADVRVPCAKGQIQTSAKLAAVHRALAAFVASKPVRLLVKQSPTPPRVWNHNNHWYVQAMVSDLPTLSWDESKQVINARVVGTPDPGYWKALGLDPTKLARRNGAVDVDLDFTGKRVR